MTASTCNQYLNRAATTGSGHIGTLLSNLVSVVVANNFQEINAPRNGTET
jgi:hypothetical protein